MYLYKLEDKDTFTNSLESSPAAEFFFFNGVLYYNNSSHQSGTFTGSIVAPSGNISLYALNVDRRDRPAPLGVAAKINQFMYFDPGAGAIIRGYDGEISDLTPGEGITASLPATATLERLVQPAPPTARPYMDSLYNTFNHYTMLSPEFEFSSSFPRGGGTDKATQDITLINIPSIFYGSRLKKKTVELNVYFSGTLTAQLKDKLGNGELIQTLPVGAMSGAVAGLVLYKEGIVCLTSSWIMDGMKDDFAGTGTPIEFQWTYYFAGMAGQPVNSRSTADDMAELDPGYFHTTPGFTGVDNTIFQFKFNGQTETQVKTILTRAPRGYANYSNNPTFLDRATTQNNASFSSEKLFVEDTTRRVKNIVSASYADVTASFTKTTYISKIALYDEERNIIGIANVAQPTKKLESRDFTFKLKLDI